jgi:hypothetical protein
MIAEPLGLLPFRWEATDGPIAPRRPPGGQLGLLQVLRADQFGRLAVLPGGWISCQWEDRGVPVVLGIIGV